MQQLITQEWPRIIIHSYFHHVLHYISVRHCTFPENTGFPNTLRLLIQSPSYLMCIASGWSTFLSEWATGCESLTDCHESWQTQWDSDSHSLKKIVEKRGERVKGLTGHSVVVMLCLVKRVFYIMSETSNELKYIHCILVKLAWKYEWVWVSSYFL